MAERIRVGILMFARGIGGSEAFVRELAVRLNRDRFDVTVIIPPWPPLRAFLADGGPPIGILEVDLREPGTVASGAIEGEASFGTEAPTSLVRRLADRVGRDSLPVRSFQSAARLRTLRRNRRALRDALRDVHLDVLHANNGGYPGASSSLAGCLELGPSATAVLLTTHSTPHPRTLLWPVERHLDRAVASSLDAAVVLARRPQAALIERRGFPSELVHVIPNGVADHGVPDRPAARTVIGSIANFNTTKDHATLVRAIERLGTWPGLRVVLAGEGPTRAATEELVRELGLGEVIVFPGTADPRVLLPELDIFVLSSHIEGLPLVVLEAMSAGLPVVASDVGGVPDAVTDGRTGFVVPPGDALALAAQLRVLLEDAARRVDFGRAGRERFEQCFSIDRMVEAYEALYVELAI